MLAGLSRANRQEAMECGWEIGGTERFSSI
jgi:hypothetical protein